jgi:hypothetical protein
MATSGINLYAGTDENGVYLTTDNGTSWKRIDGGYFYFDPVYSLVAEENNLFAGTIWNVHHSTDNGLTWINKSDNLIFFWINALAKSNSNIFAGTEGGGILCSTDNGSSWNPANSGLTNDTVHTLLAANGELFAGTSDGIFISYDNGSNWTDVSFGLGARYVRSLAINSTYLYAGGWYGVWRRPLTEMITAVLSSEDKFPKEFSLNQNYPNPFNPTTAISYQLPKRCDVSLKVFDTMGREVATLVDGIEEPGYKSINFDAKGFASGVYYYRLYTKDFSETKKLLLIR